MKMGEIMRSLKSRNREAYKATVVKQERIIQDKEREIARLKRQLAAVKDFVERALA